MILDELRALARAVFGMLQAAFPFQHRPGREPVLGQFREDGAEIDPAVAERAEASGAFDPRRIAGVDALFAGRVELGVLDVEDLHPLVIDVEVVELLQHEMRGIVEDVAALVVACRFEEALESRPVEQVFARVDLIGDVAAGIIESVQDRAPAPREFGERGFDEPRRALRPRIDVGPCERPGECRVRRQTQAL